MPHGSGLIKVKGKHAKRQLSLSYSARPVGRHDLARAMLGLRLRTDLRQLDRNGARFRSVRLAPFFGLRNVR